MRVWWLLAGLIACDGADSDTTPGETDDTEAPGETDDTEPPVDDEGEVSGRVTDADGTGVSGASVNFCAAFCKTGETDADGYYELTGAPIGEGSFYIKPAADDSFVATMNVLTVDPAVPVTMDATVYEPTHTEALPTVATEVEVAEGLFLTLGSDVLEPAIGTDLGDEVYGVMVPDVQSVYLELTNEAVALWYVNPFEAEASAGLPIRIENTWGFEQSDGSFEVWVATDPIDHTWQLAGSLAVSDDGLSLEGDALVPILTTIVLTHGDEG